MTFECVEHGNVRAWNKTVWHASNFHGSFDSRETSLDLRGLRKSKQSRRQEHPGVDNDKGRDSRWSRCSVTRPSCARPPPRSASAPPRERCWRDPSRDPTEGGRRRTRADALAQPRVLDHTPARQTPGWETGRGAGCSLRVLVRDPEEASSNRTRPYPIQGQR